MNKTCSQPYEETNALGASENSRLIGDRNAQDKETGVAEHIYYHPTGQRWQEGQNTNREALSKREGRLQEETEQAQQYHHALRNNVAALTKELGLSGTTSKLILAAIGFEGQRQHAKTFSAPATITVRDRHISATVVALLLSLRDLFLRRWHILQPDDHKHWMEHVDAAITKCRFSGLMNVETSYPNWHIAANSTWHFACT